MSNISTYTSINKIKLDKDFIFTFNVAGAIHQDFDLKFKISNGNMSNDFLISNNLNTYYKIKNDISPNFSAVKKKVSNTNKIIEFFNDKLIIHENNVYKQFNNEHQSEIKGFYYKDKKLFVKTDLYTFTDGYIIRKNPKLKEGLYLRPVIVKKTFKKALQENAQSEYFDTIDNPINSNENKTYRIIVSNNASLISFFIKDGNKFKLIKNFTYQNKISEGSIILEISNDMKLSDLHFSFFKA